MITHIEIDGFKSFNQFKMDFTPLTVIAGVNAAGKSNLFDALRLLSGLATADKIQKVFFEQRGDMLELFTHFDDGLIADRMSFAVEMLVEPKVTDAWGAEKTLKYTRLRYELTLHKFVNSIGIIDIEVLSEKLNTIKHDTDKWIRSIPSEVASYWRPPVSVGRRQTPYLYTSVDNDSIVVPQDGKAGRKRVFPLRHATKTVLSSFDSVDFPHILAAKNEMASWRFLRLNPEDLRQPTSKTQGEDEISETGKYLAATLFRIKQEDSYYLREISRKLHSFIPTFVSVDVRDDIQNKQYLIVLYDSDGKEYTSRVLSEGTLRILALCVLMQDDKFKGPLCFEEPENGVHPSRVRAMASLLRDLSSDFSDTHSPLRQVIINTHSTVFIREIKDSLGDPVLSLYFARMVRRVLSYESRKTNLSASVVHVVPRDLTPRLPFDDWEMRLSAQMLEDFLENDEVQKRVEDVRL